MKLVFSTKNKLKSPSRVLMDENENTKKGVESYSSTLSANSMDNKNRVLGSRDIHFITRRTTYNMFEVIKPTRDCNCGK
jgi:hypothetical protein